MLVAESGSGVLVSPSLFAQKIRRLHRDLLCTYKVLFGKLEMDHTDMF